MRKGYILLFINGRRSMSHKIKSLLLILSFSSFLHGMSSKGKPSNSSNQSPAKQGLSTQSSNTKTSSKTTSSPASSAAKPTGPTPTKDSAPAKLVTISQLNTVLRTSNPKTPKPSTAPSAKPISTPKTPAPIQSTTKKEADTSTTTAFPKPSSPLSSYTARDGSSTPPSLIPKTKNQSAPPSLATATQTSSPTAGQTLSSLTKTKAAGINQGLADLTAPKPVTGSLQGQINRIKNAYSRPKPTSSTQPYFGDGSMPIPMAPAYTQRPEASSYSSPENPEPSKPTSGLNNLWSRMMGYESTPTSLPANDSSRADAIARQVNEKIRMDELHRLNEEAKQKAYVDAINRHMQMKKMAQDTRDAGRQLASTYTAKDYAETDEALTLSASDSYQDSFMPFAHETPILTFGSLFDTEDTARSASYRSLGQALGNESWQLDPEPTQSLSEIIDAARYAASMPGSGSKGSARTIPVRYALPPHLECYRALIESAPSKALAASALNASLSDVSMALPARSYSLPGISLDEEESAYNQRERMRDIVRYHLTPASVRDAMRIYDRIAAEDNAHHTSLHHIASMSYLRRGPVRFYRQGNQETSSQRSKETTASFVYHSSADKPHHPQRNPDDIKPPRSIPQRQVVIDHAYIEKLKRRYNKITPQTHIQEVKKAVEEYKREAEISCLAELKKKNEKISHDLHLIHERYRQISGERFVPDAGTFDTSEYRALVYQANIKSPEEQHEFYEQQRTLRELEQQYEILHNKLKYNELLIDRARAEEEKRSTEYQCSISQHAADKLTREDIPYKEKQIVDTQALIERCAREIRNQEKLLQKTLDRLAPFSAGMAAQMIANANAASNSDYSKKHLEKDKSQLEKQIYDAKKMLAKLKNEEAMYEAQLNLAEKRVDQFNQLQEAYAPFLGVPQQKMSKEDGELERVIASTITHKQLGLVLVKGTLTANQNRLLIQSKLDKKAFEEMCGNPVQNLIYQKFNDMLGAVAEAQAKDPQNAKLSPHNEAAAILCTLGQIQNKQGNTNSAIKTLKLAVAIKQNAQGESFTSEKAKQEIGDCLVDIVQRTHDGQELADLQGTVEKIKANTDPKKEKELWLTLATAVTVMTMDNPASAPAAVVVGAVAIVLEGALGTRAISVGTAVAAAAIDPDSSGFHRIDNALKAKSQTSFSEDNKAGVSRTVDRNWPDDRVPNDYETILKSSKFTKTKLPKVKGAKVYKRDGKYYHRDTMHKGKSSHLEVYNKRGEHLGEADPLTGELIPYTVDKTKRLVL